MKVKLFQNPKKKIQNEQDVQTEDLARELLSVGEQEFTSSKTE